MLYANRLSNSAELSRNVAMVFQFAYKFPKTDNIFLLRKASQNTGRNDRKFDPLTWLYYSPVVERSNCGAPGWWPKDVKARSAFMIPPSSLSIRINTDLLQCRVVPPWACQLSELFSELVCLLLSDAV